jgi:hypothetical protein
MVKCQLVLCEVASRTGGGEIRLELQELFHVRLNNVYAQAQAEDVYTNESALSEDYHTRRPKVPFQVGWIFVYPHNGILEALPDAAVCAAPCFLCGYVS